MAGSWISLKSVSTPGTFGKVSLHVRHLRVLWDFASLPNFRKICISRPEIPSSSSFILGCKLLKYEDLISLVVIPLPGLMLKYAHNIIHCITGWM